MQVWTVLWDTSDSGPHVEVYATKALADQAVIEDVKEFYENVMERPFDDDDPKACIEAYCERQECSIDIRPTELQGYDEPVPPKITATYPEPVDEGRAL